MSKKLPIAMVLLFFTIGAFAQTIVSTTPENRNVILEEFTGINCVFCPDGHAIAEALKQSNPGDVFLVNIHSGGFANPGAGQPDFRTPWGQAIDNQSGLAGYPAGTINRQNFPGQEQGNPGTTALGRGQWVSAANVVLAQSSYLNMAVEAEIDVMTNQMTIDVEAFYTGDSPEDTNLLNVAILQNNTLGPQTGGNMGNNYVHQHRLIDMVNGQWGEVISTTSANDFVSRQYVYDIPADNNGVPIEIADLEVAVYMTETQQFVISGSGALPTFAGITATNDANLRSVADIDETCINRVNSSVNVQNIGQNPITSLDITYDVNGEDSNTFTWTGNISTLQSLDIELPEIILSSIETANELSVSIQDDENNTNNSVSTIFNQAPQTEGNIILKITTDDWAQEVSWNFTDSAGAIIESGGGFSANGSDDQQTFEFEYTLPQDCITFNMFDSFGDGLTVGGNGGVQLEDSEGLILYPFNGDYGSGFSLQFGQFTLGTDDVSAFNELLIYPNPATNELNIANAERSAIEIYDALGRRVAKVKKASQNEKIDVSRMPQGVYIVRITLDGATESKTFIKK